MKKIICTAAGLGVLQVINSEILSALVLCAAVMVGVGLLFSAIIKEAERK